ncbi:unnamed protein product [Arctia plantaginis]|uniref:Uncharacterized protein n=1 Tax=Arctia plantaginis TaxID=874455 RepID=A0A8S1AZM4_ARCPL|nr:unnamed protein product [Arctia plantaginis]
MSVRDSYRNQNLTYERMRELARAIIVAQQDAEKIVKESTSKNIMHLRRRSRSRGDSGQRALVPPNPAKVKRKEISQY